MLSYPIDEAEVLLTSKLSAAQASLSNCEEDLDFLREQITVRVLSDNLITSEIELTLPSRQWKSRQREYTIGKWYKNGRRRRAMKKSRNSQKTRQARRRARCLQRAVHKPAFCQVIEEEGLQWFTNHKDYNRTIERTRNLN